MKNNTKNIVTSNELELNDLDMISGGYSMPSAKEAAETIQTIVEWFSDWF
jgi:hypothetical protein